MDKESKEKEKSTFTIDGVEFDRSWPEAEDKEYSDLQTLEGFAVFNMRPPKSWFGDVADGDKECKLCGCRFPETDEYFHVSRTYVSKKTGKEETYLSSYCKECHKAKNKLNRKKKEIELHQDNVEYDPALHGEEPPKDKLFERATSKTPVPIPGWQQCSKCKEWQPRNRDHFKYNRGRPGIQVPRFSGTCKDCDRETRRTARHQKIIREGLKGVHGTEGWTLDDPDKKIAEAEAYLNSHSEDELNAMYGVLPAEAPEETKDTNVGCASTTEECGCRVLPISKTA